MNNLTPEQNQKIQQIDVKLRHNRAEIDAAREAHNKTAWMDAVREKSRLEAERTRIIRGEIWVNKDVFENFHIAQQSREID